MTTMEASERTTTDRAITSRDLAGRIPRADGVLHEAAGAVSWRRQTAHFALHFFEMCAPMCVGFAIGDLLYFWAAGRFGYSEPFKQLSELSLLIVTLTMTAPMVAWMAYRRMPRRPIAEMAAVMPVLAVALLILGWLSVLPMG